jgi:dTDP-4-amino-4,6-dideoxygalactose transaminase
LRPLFNFCSDISHLKSRIPISQPIKIPFNKPYSTGKETAYIDQAVKRGQLSGNGLFTHRCHRFFEERYGFGTCFLTNSCTAALEMAALLLNIQIGDEVIMPAFTFVSTANAFVLRGAKVVFVDSRTDHPGMDASQVEALISPKTKAIVAVHYAGIACDMDVLMELAEKYGLYLIEDAAQAINGFYKGRPLGSIGHLAAFSFHETKNVQCGEGGMLVVNDRQFAKRAEIIWEKGTNRAAFARKEVDHYSWIDIGSSFLPSEITAAFLYAQLENLDRIQQKRLEIWENYQDAFAIKDEKQVTEQQLSGCFDKEGIFGAVIQALPTKSNSRGPVVPPYATNNAHIYYRVFDEPSSREAYIERLNKQNIQAIFHYLPLHQSPYYKDKHDDRILTNAEHYASCLVRLPLYFELI